MTKKKSAKSQRKPNPDLISLRNLPPVASWRAMMEGFRAVYSELEKGLADDGWSMPRFQIILILYFDGPMSQVELSRRFLVTRGNISSFCRRLEKDGLIAPVSSSSKRPKIELTTKGVRQFEKIFPRHIERIKKRMITFDPKLIKQFHEVVLRNQE